MYVFHWLYLCVKKIITCETNSVFELRCAFSCTVDILLSTHTTILAAQYHPHHRRDSNNNIRTTKKSHILVIHSKRTIRFTCCFDWNRNLILFGFRLDTHEWHNIYQWTTKLASTKYPMLWSVISVNNNWLARSWNATSYKENNICHHISAT